LIKIQPTKSDLMEGHSTTVFR